MSLLAAVTPLTGVLVLPPGIATLVAASAAGALLHASQPLLVVAAQNALPQAPTAATGVVPGVGTAAAGAAYLAVGAAQDVVGLAPAMAATFALLLAGAAIGRRALP